MAEITDDENAPYREALVMARRDLAALERLRDQAIQQVEAAEQEAQKYARVVLALSRQLGEEPPTEALAVFSIKPQKRRRSSSVPSAQEPT